MTVILFTHKKLNIRKSKSKSKKNQAEKTKTNKKKKKNENTSLFMDGLFLLNMATFSLLNLKSLKSISNLFLTKSLNT